MVLPLVPIAKMLNRWVYFLFSSDGKIIVRYNTVLYKNLFSILTRSLQAVPTLSFKIHFTSFYCVPGNIVKVISEYEGNQVNYEQ